jgi:hypothetical protein
MTAVTIFATSASDAFGDSRRQIIDGRCTAVEHVNVENVETRHYYSSLLDKSLFAIMLGIEIGKKRLTRGERRSQN